MTWIRWPMNTLSYNLYSSSIYSLLLPIHYSSCFDHTYQQLQLVVDWSDP
jgi:hypothetical protein